MSIENAKGMLTKATEGKYAIGRVQHHRYHPDGRCGRGSRQQERLITGLGRAKQGSWAQGDGGRVSRHRRSPDPNLRCTSTTPRM